MTSGTNDDGGDKDGHEKADDGIADYSPIADGATVGSPSSGDNHARADAGQGPGMSGRPAAPGSQPPARPPQDVG